MDYGFGQAWFGLSLVFMGLGWAGLRILKPIPNTAPTVELEPTSPNLATSRVLLCQYFHTNTRRKAPEPLPKTKHRYF